MNMGNLFPVFEHLQPHSVRHAVPQMHQVVPLYVHIIFVITIVHTSTFQDYKTMHVMRLILVNIFVD